MSINKNIYDFMILQSIAETKLNRSLRYIRENEDEDYLIRFWDNYINNNREFDNNSLQNSLLKQLQVSVGAIKSLNPNYNDYEGGAGENTKITPEQLDYILNKYEIVDYRGNDSTGFSATVFREIGTDKLIISFRSTDSIEISNFFSNTNQLIDLFNELNITSVSLIQNSHTLYDSDIPLYNNNQAALGNFGVSYLNEDAFLLDQSILNNTIEQFKNGSFVQYYT